MILELQLKNIFRLLIVKRIINPNSLTVMNHSKSKGKVIKAPVTTTGPRIKVQLDHKTTMVVHSMAAFKMWKKRYPLAKVIA